MNKQQRESSRKTEHKINDSASSQDKINSELKLTQEAIKCKRVLELDKSIRYAGMCASDGTLVASEYKKEITPLINGTELEFAAKISAIRAMERNADDALIINKVMNELNISYTLSLCELGSRLAQSLQDPLSVIRNLVEI